MGVIDVARRAASRLFRDANAALGFSEWASYFNYGGLNYPLGYGTTTLSSKQEQPQINFESFIQNIYKTNGVIFACMVARMLLFSEARFQWRRFEKGRPGELFGDESLAILEQPWPKGTTGDLLSRAIQDADLSGNFFAARKRDRVLRMRPDWTGILVGSKSVPDDPNWQLDAEIVGYLYYRGGYSMDKDPEILLPEEVAHWAPIPDPAFIFRGMSWLQPVINEVLGDNAATMHKLKFFENGATPNLLVNVDKTFDKIETFNAFVKKMTETQTGVANAYKTLYLGSGSSATVIGANMRQVDFKVTQGAGETRICMAARIPPIIVGASEGLAAATYSNYGQARRAFADGTMRPTWRGFCGAIAPLVRQSEKTKGAHLWYDDRDISFLQEDLKDAADIGMVQAQTIKAFIDGGFTPDSSVEAVVANDFNRLKHTGLFSVQLQPPAPKTPPASTPPPTTPPAAVPPPKTKPALPAPKKSAEVEVVDEDTELTPRETQIRDRLVRRLTNKEIARELDLSVKTVENHVNAVLRKLGVRSRAEVTG